MDAVTVLIQSARPMRFLLATLGSIIGQAGFKGDLSQPIRVYRDYSKLFAISREESKPDLPWIQFLERPDLNLNQVRNIMVAESPTDLCLTVDDDVILHADCLKYLLEDFNGMMIVPQCVRFYSGEAVRLSKNYGCDLLSRSWFQSRGGYYADDSSLGPWLKDQDAFIFQSVRASFHHQPGAGSLFTEGYSRKGKVL